MNIIVSFQYEYDRYMNIMITSFTSLSTLNAHLQIECHTNRSNHDLNQEQQICTALLKYRTYNRLYQHILSINAAS